MLLAAALSAAPTAEEPPAAASRRIRAIELRVDGPLGRPIDLKTQLEFAPGDMLSEEKVQRTLVNLHATGLMAAAAILERPAAGGGVVAVVALRGHPWVDAVRLSGRLGVRRGVLERALEQRPATPLGREKIRVGLEALRQIYRARGYYQAQVEAAVVHRQGRGAVVEFVVDSGARARVGAVSFTGDIGPFRAEQLRAPLRLGSGKTFDRERVGAEAERLRRWLARRGYLAAVVEEPRISWDEASLQIDLAYEVQVGSRIEVAVRGAKARRLGRKDLLTFVDGKRPYDPGALALSRARLIRHYQEKGHYGVEVEMEEVAAEPTDDGDAADRRLLVDIEPGPEHVLREIRFEGNTQVPDRELERLLTTSKGRRFRPGDGRLVSDDLEADLANLRSYYLLQGFLDVEIGAPAVEIAGEALRLTLPITEGSRRRIVDLTFSGMEVLDPEALRGDLPVRRGGPFHPVLLTDSVSVLRALYEDEGYRSASVEPRLDWNDEGTLVDIAIEVVEGPRTVVDRVVLRGHQVTREDFIRRAVRLAPGDPVSRRRLLQVERDLYRLGIFSRVDVDLAAAADLDAGRDVLVQLDEGRRWRLSYGFSYHSDDGLGALLGVSRTNIRGRGERLQLDLRGNERDRRYRLIYDLPTLGKLNLPLTLSLFRQEEDRESFSVRDFGTQIALTKDHPRSRRGLVFDYRRVDLSAETIDPRQVEREDRELEISSLSPTIFFDYRDDPLDPTRGWNTAAQLEHAFSLFGAETEFLKFFAQQTQYLPLGRAGVIAASLRVGAIEPLDPEAVRDPLVPPELESSLVPVSERFFAGGRTSHRAYERDRLGVLGETLFEVDGELLEAGGNGLLMLNLDYRFPIAGKFGGTVFFDVGNVWADWQEVDLADVKPGVGLGARYLSPIGPVRLEVGWKLDPLDDERNPVFFLSFGNPF